MLLTVLDIHQNLCPDTFIPRGVSVRLISVAGAFLDVFGLNDGPGKTQRQRLLMLAKLMDLWELLEVPENMSFYAHGQGHAIEHDARELIYGWMDVSMLTMTNAISPWRTRQLRPWGPSSCY